QLKYRIGTIIVLVIASVWFLFPRNVTVRERGSDGLLHDVTRPHVPLQEGLDLKGGTYLALEVNASIQKIPNDKKADAIQRALKVVRTRIDNFGVSDPVVQTQGSDRIVVQIPGIQDQERARQLVQKQAYLEFKITDKTQALERDLARLDQVVKARGLAAKIDTTAKPGTAAKGLQGLLTSADTTKKSDTTKKGAKAGDSAAKKLDVAKTAEDSLKVQPGGPVSTLFEQGQIPGEFYVDVTKVPTLENYLADSAVKAALPPGKDLLPSTDSALLGGKYYRAYYLVD